ncbi:MAG TPA: metal-dependent transcriptional regulator [Acidimicrobiales bacterium]|nr:metal-dependent transcriptional regulator [Acidimicrobiales bacterium]
MIVAEGPDQSAPGTGERAKERSVSAAVEDYAKAIHHLEAEHGGAVTTNVLAERLGVTPAAVSGMLKKLDDLGMVVYLPYRGVRLSEAGRRAALGVIRRHRLLELYLAETLDLSWDRVHDEAETLEHGLSPALCELIATKLGEPQVDPHGDPIPTRDGRLAAVRGRPMSTLEVGDTGRVVRVSDRDPDHLRFLSDCRIGLGDTVTVVGTEPDGTRLVRNTSATQLVPGPVAAAVWIEAGDPGDAVTR